MNSLNLAIRLNDVGMFKSFIRQNRHTISPTSIAAAVDFAKFSKREEFIDILFKEVNGYV